MNVYGKEISVDMSKTSPQKLGSTAQYGTHLKTWTESMKAKVPGFNHKVAFTALMLANDASTQKYIEAFMRPLKDTQKSIEKSLNEADSKVPGKSLAAKAYKLDMANKDIAFMEAVYANTAKLFSESALGGMLKPNQQLTLPLQYLDAIQNSARHVVPFDAAEARTMIRQRVLRALVVDGQRYILPDAYKDPELLRKILSADNKPKEHVYTLTKRAFNIFDEAYGGEATKGMDKLNPLATIESITVVEDGADVELKFKASDNENVVTYRLRGKFNVSVKSKAKADTVYQVAGDINFETGDMTILKSEGVKAVKIKTSLNGGNFPKTFTPIEVRQDKDFVIDNHISAQFTWNPVDLQDKLTLENIDALMSATSVIYETATHLKDFYIYEELETYYNILKDTDVYGQGNYEFHQIFEVTANIAPSKDNVDNSGYMVTDPIAWRKTNLGETLDILTTNIGLKLNVEAGQFSNVLWAHPLNARQFGSAQMVFGQGETYGGVAPSVDVKVGTTGDSGNLFRMVTTQRVAQATVDTQNANKVTKYVPSIAVSNKPSQETFKFWQWMTYFDQNGQIRNPADLVHPTISYLDFFKLDMVHGIMGRLNLNNSDTFVSMAQGTQGVITK